MKLVKKVRLVFREGRSDKVYEVDLVELPSDSETRFLVNFRFGRRGRNLQEGTKTVNPLLLAEAEAIYQSVVVSKTNGGYHDEAGPAPVPRRYERLPHALPPPPLRALRCRRPELPRCSMR